MSADAKGFVEWCGIVSSYSFDSMTKALDNGNLEAAQAHLNTIRMIEHAIPWIAGPCSTLVEVAFKVEPTP